jgi:DMSO/TMAO reductase YedYZ molybdopterin-dependent catalytic subunit
MKEQKVLTPEEQLDRKIKRRTFISFSIFTALGITAFGSWRWFRSRPKTSGGLAAPARGVLDTNEKINSIFFSDAHLAPTYAVSEAAKKPRVNGSVGVSKPIDQDAWKLQVITAKNETIFVTLDELKALPKTEIIFDFKCIEGWNEVVYYGGVKFSDFIQHYQLATRSGQSISKYAPEDLFQYAGLETPNGGYYVGIDIKSVLHPQTILCYELNGKPLPANHGAPLRLIIPVKYGIKNLKRIGKIFFSDERPRDFWAERAYDYDAAL